MMVLRATEKQRSDLDGYTSGNSKIVFVETILGPIVSKRVLDDPAFKDIRSKLLGLEEVDYIPPPPEDE